MKKLFITAGLMSAGFFGLTSVHASECGYEKLQGSEFSLTDMSKNMCLTLFC